MNRSILAAIVAALLFAGLGGSARADDRADIDALYAKLALALKNKTPEATLALETPDFIKRDGRGASVTGRQLVQQMKQQDASVKSIKSVTFTVKSAVIKGNSAKVITDMSYAVEIVDKDGHLGDKGGTHEMLMNGLVRDNLVKTPAGWKFKFTQTGTGTILIDGKSVVNPKPGTVRKIRK